MVVRTKIQCLFLILLSILIPKAFAQEAPKAVRITVAAVYLSKRIYRGALIWDAPIMAAGPSFVFYDKVSLGQGGLSVFKKFAHFHTATLGATFFNDNQPNGPILKLKNRASDFKNQRGSTYGVYLKHDFKFKRYMATSLTYFLDLRRNHGNYANARISTSMIPFLTVGAGLGWGDLNNNKYVYGPEAMSGLGHIDGFVSAMLPGLPWHGRLSLNYSLSQIAKITNQQADYIRGNDLNSFVSFAAMWNI